MSQRESTIISIPTSNSSLAKSNNVYMANQNTSLPYLTILYGQNAQPNKEHIIQIFKGNWDAIATKIVNISVK